MASKRTTIALISGSNTGIGLAVATQLAKDHGYHVIIGSRSAAAGAEAAASLTKLGLQASSVQLDLLSDESIAAAAHAIEKDFGKLDVLINNAGVLLDRPSNKSDVSNKPLHTRDLFQQTFSTNVIGAACLTEACVPLLRKALNPRLVFVSSRMGSLSESTNKSRPWYPNDYKAYDASKAALNVLAVNYARILEPNGALVNIACPGLVKTKMTNYIDGGASTDVGARRIVELATLSEDGPTATFSDSNGPIEW